MEEQKQTVVKEPVKKVKKVAAKKAMKKTIIETNLARGFFATGFLGIVFFALIVFEVLNPAMGIPEELLQNDVQLLQTSIGLFLIGAFSFTKK